MVSKLRIASFFLLFLSFTAVCANAQQKKPNILVIFGDDVGYWNVSAYNLGHDGLQTPNIDRIANRARSSPTTTRNRVARLAAPHLLLARARFALD